MGVGRVFSLKKQVDMTLPIGYNPASLHGAGKKALGGGKKRLTASE
jgi:hypothetical protein